MDSKDVVIKVVKKKIESGWVQPFEYDVIHISFF